MIERTATGNRKPPIRRPFGRSSSHRRRPASGSRSAGTPSAAAAGRGDHFGSNAGKGSLAALPWALAILGASAVFAAATVIGR